MQHLFIIKSTEKAVQTHKNSIENMLNLRKTSLINTQWVWSLQKAVKYVFSLSSIFSLVNVHLRDLECLMYSDSYMAYRLDTGHWDSQPFTSMSIRTRFLLPVLISSGHFIEGKWRCNHYRHWSAQSVKCLKNYWQGRLGRYYNHRQALVIITWPHLPI